jgi:hypothetical protein
MSSNPIYLSDCIKITMYKGLVLLGKLNPETNIITRLHFFCEKSIQHLTKDKKDHPEGYYYYPDKDTIPNRIKAINRLLDQKD